MTKLAWGSCTEVPKANMEMAKVLNSGVTHFVHLGDLYYNVGLVYVQAWGGHLPANTLHDDLSQANFEDHFLQAKSVPGIKYLIENTIFYYMPDDHEYVGDNHDGSISKAEAGVGGLTGATQADVDTGFVNMWAAFDAIFPSINPVNTDSEAIAQKCLASDLTDAAYPPRYFRFTEGNIEYFVLDCLSHRDPADTTDRTTYGQTGQATMLGTNQLAWLKEKLKTSTATYKVILNQKKTFASETADNGDIWDSTPGVATLPGYTEERDEILAFIHAGTNWVVYGGVVWCVGDRHTPEVMATYITDNKDPDIASAHAFDHVCICACPLSVSLNSSIGTPSTATIVIDQAFGHVYGTVEEKSDHLKLQLISFDDGAVKWTGKINAGENKLSYYNEASI